MFYCFHFRGTKSQSRTVKLRALQLIRPRGLGQGRWGRCLLPTNHCHRLYPMGEKRYFSLCVVLLVSCAAWIPGKNFSFLFTLEANSLCSVLPWWGQVADTQLCLNSLSFLKMACHHWGPAIPASVEPELSKGEQMRCLHWDRGHQRRTNLPGYLHWSGKVFTKISVILIFIFFLPIQIIKFSLLSFRAFQFKVPY